MSLEWYYNNRDLVKQQQIARAAARPVISSKKCKECKKEKNVEEFSPSKTSCDGYEHQCKECYNKKYREEYYPEIREEKLAKNKEWRNNNVEYRKEYKRAHHQQYYAENKDKFIERARLRDMRKRNAAGHHTQQQWRDLVTMYGRICLKCKEIPEEGLTKDHIVALTNGGTDWIWNIQPLCFPCNRKKWTQTIDYRLGFVFAFDY